MKKLYKGILLNQTCVVEINGINYWLLYENDKDDYILIKFDGCETRRLGQGKTPNVARLSLFDDNLRNVDYGNITKILVFKDGYNCLCYLQNKGKACYQAIKVEQPKVITMDDIKEVFGENILLNI